MIIRALNVADGYDSFRGGVGGFL